MSKRQEIATLLQAMKWDAFQAALQDQWNDPGRDEQSFDERLHTLITSEFYDKKNIKTERLIRLANFRNSQACPEGFNVGSHRTFDRSLAEELLTCLFIERRKNLVVMGPTGAGKSYFAQALGVAACRRGITTSYVQLTDLLEGHHIEAMKDPQKARLYRKRFMRKQLLIIDEFLLYPINEGESQFLMRLLDHRRDHFSTIIVSQYSPDEWIGKVDNGLAGEALADRIASGAYRIMFESKESLRKE